MRLAVRLNHLMDQVRPRRRENSTQSAKSKESSLVLKVLNRTLSRFYVGSLEDSDMTYRIATDVGGTFTDAVLLDEETGEVRFEKVPTTPRDFAKGTIDAVDRFGVQLEKCVFLAHGTTVAINALIEGKGAKTGLITTKGFRDVTEIGRSNRTEMYDPLYRKPRPLVDRYLRLEVDERIRYDGSILTALAEEDVNQAVAKFRESEVGSVAVCLMNSYANPVHEIRIGEIVMKNSPNVSVSLSHMITREYREYERTSTTILNAHVMPVVERYLESIEQKLTAREFSEDLLIMQSNGGTMTCSTARTQPIGMIESGPAGGVIGAAILGKMLGHDNIVSYDMGGTTAKSGLIEGGAPRVTMDYKVGGYPLRIPVVDLMEIGAGGGSIAWIDSAGALHVGPKSAGADPGPAAYGAGGTEPTVTDADLLLGRLNSEYFLGGQMKVFPDLARKALERVADFFKKDVIESAYGIVTIVNANMSALLRAMTIRRGYDPRELVAVAFGGAGPMHVAALAKELGISKIVVPKVPGNFSAWGMLVTNIRHDFVQTFVKPVADADVDELDQAYGSLERNGMAILRKEKVKESNIHFLRAIDIRYLGQEHTLTIPLMSDNVAEQDKQSICNRFDELHEKTYRHSAPQEPKEIVNLRITAIGVLSKPKLGKIGSGPRRPSEDAFKGTRPVYFERENDFVKCPTYERDRLLSGNIIEGPAVIEEPTSTTLVHPGQTLTVDTYGDLLINVGGN